MLDDPPQTEEVVLIVAFGNAWIVTDLFDDVVAQPLLFVTITEMVTVPDDPAV